MEELFRVAAQCYQCGKCSAGCPVQFAMDIPPNQVMRLLQRGLIDEVLTAKSIWVCASCNTCTTRCLRGIDIAATMDELRRLAMKKGVADRHGRNANIFHDVFLGSIKRYGRLYELGLAIQLNLKTGNLFKDAQYSWPMFSKGKLKLFPESINGLNQINKIYQAAREMGDDI